MTLHTITINHRRFREQPEDPYLSCRGCIMHGHPWACDQARQALAREIGERRASCVTRRTVFQEVK